MIKYKYRVIETPSNYYEVEMLALENKWVFITTFDTKEKAINFCIEELDRFNSCINPVEIWSSF